MKEREVEFKKTCDTAKKLSNDLDPDTVRSMMIELKKTKQALMLIKSKITERQQKLPVLLQHVEAVEAALASVEQWLNGGEQLLASHKIDGNINDVEERLKQHKVSV